MYTTSTSTTNKISFISCILYTIVIECYHYLENNVYTNNTNQNNILKLITNPISKNYLIIFDLQRFKINIYKSYQNIYTSYMLL